MHRLGGTVHFCLGGEPDSPSLSHFPPTFLLFRPWLRLWPNLWHGQVLTIHTTQKFRRADSSGLEMDEFRSIVFGGRVTPGVFESIITGFKVVSSLPWFALIFFPASSFPTLYFLLPLPLLPVSNPPLSVHGLERLSSSVLLFACLILGGTAGARSSFTFLIGLLAILRYMISRRRFGWFCAFVTCLTSFLEQDA